MSKKESPNINSKLIAIRRQQRSQELQQIRNSMRFNNQSEFYKRMAIDSNNKQYELTQEHLRSLLKHQDLQGLYEATTQASFEAIDLSEQFGAEIVDFLKRNLSSPIGVLSLGNMVNNFQVCGDAVVSSNCFQQLLSYLGKLSPGSQCQAPYIWTLCVLTDQPKGLEHRRLNPLVTIIQQILKQQMTSEKGENMHLFRLIKNLSEINHSLNEDLTIEFANHFWMTTDQSIKLNIYLTCCNLITKALFRRSTKVLMHLLAVGLRGKQHLQNAQLGINIEQILLRPHALLRQALSFYNEDWECMEVECDFEIKGNSLRLGLHSFLLTLEGHIFVNRGKQCQFYDFLYQFCKHAPIEFTLHKWLDLGTFDGFEKSLTASHHACYQTLKVLQLFVWRIVNQQPQRSTLLETVKSTTRIVQSVEEALYLFPQPQILELGQRVLSVFQDL